MRRRPTAPSIPPAVVDLGDTTSLKLGYDGLIGSGLASGALTATFTGKF